jgi:hypothetical protein
VQNSIFPALATHQESKTSTAANRSTEKLTFSNLFAAKFYLYASGSLRGMVRQLSIDQFENESRRVSMGTDSISKALPSPMFERNSNEPCVSKVSSRSLFRRTCVLRTLIVSQERIRRMYNRSQ